MEEIILKNREFVELAVLPLQNTAMFPDTVVPLAVGRERSMKAVEASLATEEKLIACVTIKTPEINGSDAKPIDIYEIGTIVNVKRMMRNDDVLQLIVQGIERIKIISWTQEQPFLKAKVEILPNLKVKDLEEVEALKRNIQGMIQQALVMLPQVPPEVRTAVMAQGDPVQLSYFIGSVLDLGVETEQRLLEAESADELLIVTHGALAKELEIMQIRSKIANEAQAEMDKEQRNYVLRMQMKAIQKELGEVHSEGIISEKNLYDKTKLTTVSNTAFIIMWMDPNHPELDDVANTIKEVCNAFGIYAKRADDIEHQDKITDVVLEQISKSEFLIADLTGERPNVYYEIGYAHALGKRPILFRREGTSLHFDLYVHNVPIYKNLTELKQMLLKRFEAILGKSPSLQFSNNK